LENLHPEKNMLRNGVTRFTGWGPEPFEPLVANPKLCAFVSLWFKTSRRPMHRPSLACLVALSALSLGASDVKPPVPLVFENNARVESTADGGLRLAVGVHNIQVVRANRTHAAQVHADALAHTYLHAPMLAWWRGKLHLEYLSGPVGEHETVCETSLTTSADGLHWEKPQVVFPAFALPDGTQTLAHQRMGFYVAPDGPLDKLGAGRLLVLAFYGQAPSPNDGTGIGRAVREVREDGTFAPIHFIRLNAKQPFPGFTPPYPPYTASADRGFVAACEALLANKLMTAQWWEEDQLDESGFYTIRGKALSFVHRPDGSVLGIWKNALVAATRDEGRTWTEKQFGLNLPNNASKYWLQRTGDGRFALFLNPTNRLRFPLAVATSDDGFTFSNLLTVHGELPDQRFAGTFKNLGPQYVRGIVEGNGTPADVARAAWVTYSVNKEDIWVSRVPVPIRATVDAPVREDFESTAAGALPDDWNIYSPAWAPVRVVDTAGPAGRALELRDEEPCDYARAIRVFPETHGVKISFKVLARQTTGRLEIELLGSRGERPYVLALGEDGRLRACHEGVWTDNGAYETDRWHEFRMELPRNPATDRIDVFIDGRPASPPSVGVVEAAPTIERLSFRTGQYRERGYGGRDLPGADEKAPAAVFLIDDVAIEPER
jgi:hypothetical protein